MKDPVLYVYYDVVTENEMEKMKSEEKDNKELNEMFFNKPEEILNKSDELEKNQPEDQEDQDI